MSTDAAPQKRLSVAEYRALISQQSAAAPVKPAAFGGKRQRKKPRTCLSEHDEQAQLIASLQDPALQSACPGIEELYAIPNGGHRSRTTAIALKAEGVKPGVSDLFLPVPLHGFHGLYLEMKAHDGHLSCDQLDFLNKATSRGYACVVCKGAAAGRAALQSYYEGKLAAGLITTF
jgi:hypothetical protein